MRVFCERPGSAVVHVASAELFNLLINPANHNFALRWHRDDVRENATAEEEREAPAAWPHGVCIIRLTSIVDRR